MMQSQFIKWFLGCTLFLSGCSYTETKIIDIKQVATNVSFAEDQALAKDLVSYDYTTSLFNRYPEIFTPDVISNVRWKFHADSISFKVHYKLLLANSALAKEKEVVNAFTNFIESKIQLHLSDSEFINLAVRKAKIYSEMIKFKMYDSLWSEASTQLQNFMTKSKFVTLLERMPAEFRPKGGGRSLHSRLIYTDIQGLKEKSYVINFVYPNNVLEQFTLSRMDQLKLVGYRTDTVPSKR